MLLCRFSIQLGDVDVHRAVNLVLITDAVWSVNCVNEVQVISVFSVCISSADFIDVLVGLIISRALMLLFVAACWFGRAAHPLEMVGFSAAIAAFSVCWT